MNLSVLMIVLVPIMLIFVMLIFILADRYIRYKERVALARLGFSLDEIRQSGSGTRGNRGVLWGGVITAMSGLALLVGLGTLGLGVWLLGGFLPLFVGIGMILIYFVTGDAGSSQVKPKAADALDDENALVAELEAEDPFEGDEDLVASVLAAGPPTQPGTQRLPKEEDTRDRSHDDMGDMA